MPTVKVQKALNRSYDQYKLLAIDENSDLLHMATYLEFECDPLAKTHICSPLKILFAVFYRTDWIELADRYGQECIYKNFAACSIQAYENGSNIW